MKFNTRKMKVTDFSEIRSLLLKEGMINDKFTQQKFKARTELFGDYSYVSLYDGRIIGSVFGSHDFLTGHINKITVDEKYRRNGIGYSLLRLSTVSLLEQGLRPIYFHTKPDNTAMLELSASLGFEINTSRRLVDLNTDDVEGWKRRYSLQKP